MATQQFLEGGAAAIHKKISSLYEVKKQAAQDAAQDLPHWDAREWSTTEKNILRDIEQSMASLVDAAKNSFAEKMSKLLEIQQSFNSTYYVDSHAHDLDDLKALFSEDKIEQKYMSYYKPFKEAERYYKYFRHENDLHREAVYPPSKIYNISKIVGVCFIEALLNSYLFARGSDFGLIGGAASALIVSVINAAGFGFLFGHIGLPRRNLKNKTKRFFGYMIATIAIFMVLTFNLAVGHYRAELIAGSLDPAKDAMASFLSNPTDLADLESWLLFGIGIIAFTWASYEYYRLDDKYPEYGDVDRRYKEQHANVVECLKKIDMDARKIRDMAKEKIDIDYRKYKEHITEYARVIPALVSDVVSAKVLVEENYAAFQTLIWEYRSVNGGIRGARQCDYWKEDLPLINYVQECERLLVTAGNAQAAAAMELERMKKDADVQREKISIDRTHMLEAASIIVTDGMRLDDQRLAAKYNFDHSLDKNDDS